MSTESIDRTTRMTTTDQARQTKAAASPFFLAAIGMTIALVVLGAVVALVF
jgi:hypothetical protein